MCGKTYWRPYYEFGSPVYHCISGPSAVSSAVEPPYYKLGRSSLRRPPLDHDDRRWNAEAASSPPTAGSASGERQSLQDGQGSCTAVRITSCLYKQTAGAWPPASRWRWRRIWGAYSPLSSSTRLIPTCIPFSRSPIHSRIFTPRITTLFAAIYRRVFF